MALRRRRRQVGASTASAPMRSTARAMSRRARRPAAASRARGPTTAIRPRSRRRRVRLRTAAATARDRNVQAPRRSRRRVRCFGDQPDCDAAESGDRHVHRHAHAAHGTAHHDTFAMQIDDAPPFVRRLVGGLETDGQNEGVEPRYARPRPGRQPAGFHLTPRNSAPRQAVAARLPRTMPRARRNRLKIWLIGRIADGLERA